MMSVQGWLIRSRLQHSMSSIPTRSEDPKNSASIDQVTQSQNTDAKSFIPPPISHANINHIKIWDEPNELAQLCPSGKESLAVAYPSWKIK